MKKLGIAALFGLIGYLVYLLFNKKKVAPVTTTPQTTAYSGGSVSYIPSSGTTVYTNTIAEIDSETSTTTGTVAEGKLYVKITNQGAANGTIDIGNGDITLEPGDAWEYEARQIYGKTYLSAEISFDATGTEFLIETQEI